MWIRLYRITTTFHHVGRTLYTLRRLGSKRHPRGLLQKTREKDRKGRGDRNKTISEERINQRSYARNVSIEL